MPDRTDRARLDYLRLCRQSRQEPECGNETLSATRPGKADVRATRRSANGPFSELRERPLHRERPTAMGRFQHVASFGEGRSLDAVLGPCWFSNAGRATGWWQRLLRTHGCRPRHSLLLAHPSGRGVGTPYSRGVHIVHSATQTRSFRPRRTGPSRLHHSKALALRFASSPSCECECDVRHRRLRQAAEPPRLDRTCTIEFGGEGQRVVRDADEQTRCVAPQVAAFDAGIA